MYRILSYKRPFYNQAKVPAFTGTLTLEITLFVIVIFILFLRVSSGIVELKKQGQNRARKDKKGTCRRTQTDKRTDRGQHGEAAKYIDRVHVSLHNFHKT